MIAAWHKKIDYEKMADLILQLIHDYERLGPLPGILLPFIEALLPFLPLVMFVLANVAVYGFVKGFLYSWIGSTLGSVTVFLMIRYLGRKSLFQRISHNKQVLKVTSWVERHGFGLLFILLCFPFSPSSVINVVAGLSKLGFWQF